MNDSSRNDGLNDKQRMFVEEYMIDFNGKQAAIRAGYSPKCAEVTASKLLSKAKVHAYKEVLMAEASRRTGVSVDRVIRELARLAFINPTKAVNFDTVELQRDAKEDDLAAVASIRVKRIVTDDNEIEEREIKFFDKQKSLDSLGKYLGMFTEKVKIDANVTTTDKLAALLDSIKESDSNDDDQVET